jgi:hypothetical protein
MWIYSGEALEHRLRLHPGIGFLLDYWLLLHGEDTHPIWCARPLGIQELGRVALKCRAGHDVAIKRQLIQEVRHVFRLLSALREFLPLLPEEIPASAQEWPDEWLRWFDTFQRADPAPFVQGMVDALGDALTGGDLSRAAFLLRRLSAELGEDDWSKHQLASTLLNSACLSGSFDDGKINESRVADAFSPLLATRGKRKYEVLLSVAPVHIPARTAKKPFSKFGAEIVLDRDPDNQRIITGIQSVVEASHPNHAVSEAHSAAIRVLDALRLRDYVHTNLYGKASIRDLSEETELLLPLRQPFWTPKSHRRSPPTMPMRYNALADRFDISGREQWYAARWHLSQAFAGWAEDVHGAAAKVWQAMESFVPGKAPAVIRALGDAYLRGVSFDVAPFLATRINQQGWNLRELLKRTGETSDWHCWDSQKYSVEKWMGRVLDHRSFNNFSRWSRPQAPLVAFDPAVGLVQIISRRLRYPESEIWMERRVRADLALLYGLRNRVVHRGSRVFSARMAEYLGQLGLEVLLGVMNQISDAAAKEEHEQALNLREFLLPSVQNSS